MERVKSGQCFKTTLCPEKCGHSRWLGAYVLWNERNSVQYDFLIETKNASPKQDKLTQCAGTVFTNQWLCQSLWLLQCINNGVTSVLLLSIEIMSFLLLERPPGNEKTLRGVVLFERYISLYHAIQVKGFQVMNYGMWNCEDIGNISGRLLTVILKGARVNIIILCMLNMYGRKGHIIFYKHH